MSFGLHASGKSAAINAIVDSVKQLYPELEMVFVNQNMPMHSVDVAQDVRCSSWGLIWPRIFIPTSLNSRKDSHFKMEALLKEIRACAHCKSELPYGPNPVVQASEFSRIALVGQAPGRRVHESGIPWDDQSGKNLRAWLGVDESVFYDPAVFALIPMGFCYPGSGKNGDLPPRPECAPLWHDQIFNLMPHLELTVLIGKYAQDHYLSSPKKNLTENVKSFQEFLPSYFPLPHPSPRNAIWQAKNPWFKEEVLIELRIRISGILNA